MFMLLCATLSANKINPHYSDPKVLLAQKIVRRDALKGFTWHSSWSTEKQILTLCWFNVGLTS